MTSTLQGRFSDLLQHHVRKLTIRGQRAVGLCPLHPDRHPSFSADTERCVWYCHACGRGGCVRDFALALGEEWVSARSESRTAKAHRAALAAARDAYHVWQREKLIALTDEYRELVAECEIAEIGYCATYRCPNLYSESERLRWTHRLTSLYDRLAVLEHDLDVLTFGKWEPERFSWWQEEGKDEQLAA